MDYRRYSAYCSILAAVAEGQASRSLSRPNPGRTTAWVRDRLARFKCPVGVSFVPSLARTASGKLQKQAIRARLGSVAVP
jgi:acyl-CoA synthetase (AMP-forming)/AMP-acid ligase II